MFKSNGILEVNDGLRIVTQLDFNLYYKWLIERYHWNTVKLQLPKHRGHITLINPKIHKGFTYTPAIPYIGKKIEFQYDPLKIYESKVNFWIPIKCELGEQIKKECGIIENSNYWGLHFTIANTKYEN